jgi:hypothetical protein
MRLNIPFGAGRGVAKTKSVREPPLNSRDAQASDNLQQECIEHDRLIELG